MGAPVLVGAGVGALASLATGRDPFQGAALGGLTGGAFGGASGFGSGFTEGGLFGSALPDAAMTASGQGLVSDAAANSVISSTDSLLGNTGLNTVYGSPMSSFGDQALNTGFGVDLSQGLTANIQNVGGQAMLNIPDSSIGVDLIKSGAVSGAAPSLNAVDTANLLGAPQTGFFENLGNTAYESLANMSPLEQVQLGGMTLDAFSPEEQAQVQAQLGQIKPAEKRTAGTPLQVKPPRPTYKPRFA